MTATIRGHLVTDANGNVTSYSYNGNMKNDCVTFPDGHTIRYEFDVEDRVVRTIDQQNNATVVAYDDGAESFPSAWQMEHTFSMSMMQSVL